MAVTRWQSRWVTTLGIVACGMALRFGAYAMWQPLFAMTPGEGAHGSGAYDLYATNLLSTGVYGLVPGTPDAVLPPLYAAALAAVYRIASRSTVWIVALNATADAITILAIRRLGARLFRNGAAVGAMAAIAVACYPYLVFQSLTVIDTSVFAALLYVFLVLVVALRDAPDGARSFRMGLAAGAVWGLAMLTRPVLPFLALFAAVWLTAALGWRRGLLRLAPVALAGALVVTPWIVRNWRVAGVPSFTTNAGSNFWQGNNPQTLAYLRAGYDVQWIPAGPSQARDPLGADADRALFRRAVTYLRTHPGAIPALIWAKFLVYWSIDVTPRRNPGVDATRSGAGGLQASTSSTGMMTLSGLRPDDPIAAYSQPLFERLGRTVTPPLLGNAAGARTCGARPDPTRLAQRLVALGALAGADDRLRDRSSLHPLPRPRRSRFLPLLGRRGGRGHRRREEATDRSRSFS